MSPVEWLQVSQKFAQQRWVTVAWIFLQTPHPPIRLEYPRMYYHCYYYYTNIIIVIKIQILILITINNNNNIVVFLFFN